MYRKSRLFLLSILYRFPLTKLWAYKRLPRHRSGYKRHWVGEQGKNQRETLRERQSVTLQRFFPTVYGLSRIVAYYNPKNVLDIGCGYGRFLEGMHGRFLIEGCDVAPDLLEKVRPDLQDKVFQLDITNPPPDWVKYHQEYWDVSYAWAVFMYFIDDQESMKAAMSNAAKITKKKVIVWDWKHVCDYMKLVYPSDKFEYHYIPLIMG